MNKILLFLVLCYSSLFSLELSAQMKEEIVDFVVEIDRASYWIKYDPHVYIGYFVVFRNGEVRSIVYQSETCTKNEQKKFFKKGDLRKGDLVEIVDDYNNRFSTISYREDYAKCIVTSTFTIAIPYGAPHVVHNQREGTFYISPPFPHEELKNRGNIFLITNYEDCSRRLFDAFEHWNCTTIEGFGNERFLFYRGNKEIVKPNEYLEYIGPSINLRGDNTYLFKNGTKKAYFVKEESMNWFTYGRHS